MKKRKKKSLYRRAITYLISGALLTLASGGYILYDALHPRTVEPVFLLDDKPKTIIDLDYKFDYSNNDNFVSMLTSENTDLESEVIIEPKKVYNTKAKEVTNKTVSNQEITQKKQITNTETQTSKTNTTNETKKEEIKEETPKTEFTAILEKKANDEDFKKVCEKYNLTEDELYTVIAIVGTEGGGRNYTEAYAIINTIYNRTLSKKWSSYVKSLGGNGNSLFGQATAKGQFTVYASGTYKNKMYDKSSKAYSAVINFLLDLNIMHDYLSFRPKSSGKEGEQFVSGGNIYLNELKSSDRI